MDDLKTVGCWAAGVVGVTGFVVNPGVGGGGGRGGIGLLAVGGVDVNEGCVTGGGVGDGGDAGLVGGGVGGVDGRGGNGWVPAIGKPMSLMGKFGGIFISGVSGLAVPPVAFSEGVGPFGLGGVMPLGWEGTDEDGGLLDPETGGLISSAI